MHASAKASVGAADLYRKFLLSINFLHIKGLYYNAIHIVVTTESRLSSVKALIVERFGQTDNITTRLIP